MFRGRARAILITFALLHYGKQISLSPIDLVDEKEEGSNSTAEHRYYFHYVFEYGEFPNVIDEEVIHYHVFTPLPHVIQAVICARAIGL
jgi:hypothetical protein